MKSGDLVHAITIISDLPTQSPSGHYVPGSHVVCRALSSIRGVRGKDTLEQATEQQSETLEFTTRWRPDVDTAMIVEWRGTRYEIERVDPVPYERQFMRIWAHSLRKVGR